MPDHKSRLYNQELTQGKPDWIYKLGRKRKGDSEAGQSPKKTKTGEAEQTGEGTSKEQNKPMDEDVVAQDTTANTAGGDTGRSKRNVSSSNSAGGSNGGASNIRGTAELYKGLRSQPLHASRLYTKQYKLRIYNELIDARIATNNVESCNVIRHPYHDIPVHLLGFYLSKEEIYELRQYTACRVRRVYVEAHHKTAILTFSTNASTSNIGNNNVGVYLSSIAKDMHKKRYGILPSQSTLIEEVFWGKHASLLNLTNNFTTNLHQLGAEYIERNFSNKFQYYSPYQSGDYGKDQNSMDYKANFFNIQPFIAKRTNASMTEGLFDTYEYIPEDGLVMGSFHMGKSTIARDTGEDNLIVKHQGGGAYFNSENDINMHEFAPPRGTEAGKNSPAETGSLILLPFRNTQPGGFSSIPIDERAIVGHSGSTQPPFIIGIDPLTTVNKKDGKFEPVNAHINIILNVYLEMEITNGVDYLHPNGGRPRQPAYIDPPMVYSLKMSHNQNANFTCREVNKTKHSKTVYMQPNINLQNDPLPTIGSEGQSNKFKRSVPADCDTTKEVLTEQDYIKNNEEGRTKFYNLRTRQAALKRFLELRNEQLYENEIKRSKATKTAE